MAEAQVEFDYKAQESDELTIKKGDILTDISIKPGGWWEGTLMNGGKRGMFPNNFVKLIKNEDGEAAPVCTGRRCKVLFAYKPSNNDELELQVDDVIDIVAEVEEGWWKGVLKNKVGVFPSNFVAEITESKSDVREASQRKPKISRDESVKQNMTGMNVVSTSESSSTIMSSESTSDLPVLPPKPAKEYYRAMFKYESQNVDELSLNPGDVIMLVTKEGQDPGWWKGELKGKIGVFPDNFVDAISVEEPIKFEVKTKSSSRTGSTHSISKSATTSSICESLTSSFTKKFSESSKIADDKVPPPTVSKKPVLPPPPNKKPIGSHSSTRVLESPPSGQPPKVVSSSTTTTTIKHGASSITETSSVSSTSNKWTVLETSDVADGLSWSRQSYSLKDQERKISEGSTGSVNLLSNNNIGSSNEQLDLDVVGRAEMLSHPTANRAKAPKTRPPSTIITKEDMMKNGEDESPESEMLLNGDAEVHNEKPSSNTNQPPPWVEELKLSQAKKSMQGKTRVMIGMSESMISESKSSLSSGSSSSLVTLRQRQEPVVGQRPQSMLSTLKSHVLPSLPSATSETITVSLKQWNDLLEKVAILEISFESQIGTLNKAVKDLTGKLDDERQRRIVIQQELEKLTDLVTQV